MQIDNQFYKAVYDEKGKVEITPKIPSVLKKKESGKELPRYSVIVEYEREFKGNFSKTIESMAKNIDKVFDELKK